MWNWDLWRGRPLVLSLEIPEFPDLSFFPVKLLGRGKIYVGLWAILSHIWFGKDIALCLNFFILIWKMKRNFRPYNDHISPNIDDVITQSVSLFKFF